VPDPPPIETVNLDFLYDIRLQGGTSASPLVDQSDGGAANAISLFGETTYIAEGPGGAPVWAAPTTSTQQNYIPWTISGGGFAGTGLWSVYGVCSFVQAIKQGSTPPLVSTAGSMTNIRWRDDTGSIEFALGTPIQFTTSVPSARATLVAWGLENNGGNYTLYVNGSEEADSGFDDDDYNVISLMHNAVVNVWNGGYLRVALGRKGTLFSAAEKTIIRAYLDYMIGGTWAP
jgi:hypothetical protein